MVMRKKQKPAKGGGSTRRITTETVVDTPPEDDFTDIDDPFLRVRTQWGDSVDGGSVRMTVLRVEAGNRPAYLESVDYNEELHGPDWIREMHGPGNYILRFLERSTQEIWSKNFTIARLKSDEAGGIGDELTRTYREQNERLLGAMLSGRGGGGAAAPAPAQMDPAIKAIMDQQAATTQMLLQMLLNKPDTTSLLISGAEKMFEAVSHMKGDASGDWMSQLPRLAKELGPVLQNVLRPGPVAPGAVPAAAVPVGAGTTMPPPPIPAPVGSPGFTRTGVGNSPATPMTPVSDIAPHSGTMDDFLRSWEPHLLEAVEKGIHPGDAANGILDSLPAVYHETLKEVTSDKLRSVVPTLGVHGAWLDEMVRFVHEGGYESQANEGPSTG